LIGSIVYDLRPTNYESTEYLTPVSHIWFLIRISISKSKFGAALNRRFEAEIADLMIYISGSADFLMIGPSQFNQPTLSPQNPLQTFSSNLVSDNPSDHAGFRIHRQTVDLDAALINTGPRNHPAHFLDRIFRNTGTVSS